MCVAAGMASIDASTRGTRRRTTRRTVSVALRRVLLHAGLLASSEVIGSLHDRAKRRGRHDAVLEHRQQFRQRFDGTSDQRLHAFVRLDGAIQHAIEHVLHAPGEFAQHAGADQTTRTLQRMEGAADRGEFAKLALDRPAKTAARAAGCAISSCISSRKISRISSSMPSVLVWKPAPAASGS